MGLRERKKQYRNQRVLAAAEDLFHELGFEATTMSAVARRAELAVGTLYNYYSSKDILFVAVLKKTLASQVAGVQRKLPDMLSDPASFVIDVFRGVFALVGMHDRELWQEFMVSVYKARRTLDEPVFELDWMLIAELETRLARLQKAHVIDASLNLERVAMILFGCFLMRFQMYLMALDCDLETFRNDLGEDVEMIVRGLTISGGDET